MTDFLESLPVFSMDGLRPVFDELAGEQKNAAIELGDNYKHISSPARRMMDLRKIANAAKSLDGLPAVGQSWHLISKGNFSQWDYVPAVLQLCPGSTIRYLGIVTLSFSQSNLEQLIGLLDSGQVEAVDFAYSVYYRSVEKSACERLQYEMHQRGGRVACCRLHAKIILLEFSSGENFTIESSANLRSCRNIEQSTFTNDAALLTFHRTWISELMEK